MVKRNINWIVLITTVIFMSEWMFSFFFYDENLLTKLIFESNGDGYYYFTYVKFLSDLDFSNSYDPNIENLKKIAIPYSSVFIHAILFIIINFYSFFLLEFVVIFFFLFLFYKILSKIFSQKKSILISVFFFSTPYIITLLNNLEINIQFLEIIKTNFYTLRFPRPSITTLFFLLFIYILNLINEELWNIKFFIFIGIVIGLSFSSFYYYSIIELLVFIIFFLRKFKSNFFYLLLNKFKYFLICFISFSIVISPFVYNLMNVEPDYLLRMGVLHISIEEKYNIIKYFFSRFKVLNFVLIIILSIFLHIYLNQIIENETKEYINIFFYIFICSIISPFVFLLLSNKISLLYHFNNITVVWSFVYLVIATLKILEHKYFKLITNFKYNNALIFFLLSLIITSNIISDNNFYNNHSNIKHRIDFDKTINDLQKLEVSNKSLLTLDNEIMIWSILNNIKYMPLMNGLFTPKPNSMIEDDLIKNLRILKLTRNDFEKFIENRKQKWRYYNNNVRDYFLMTYTANSVKTLNNSSNFEKDELNQIAKTNPSISQQLIIPKEELLRLANKFENHIDDSSNMPDIIVIKNNKILFRNFLLTQNIYCTFGSNDSYLILINKNLNFCS